MQRFFVLNENMLCTAEGEPKFTVCSQTPLTTCLMTVLAVKGGAVLVVGQGSCPMPEWTIRLAAYKDIDSFNVPECHHEAILQQEAETAMSIVSAHYLVILLCKQAAGLAESTQLRTERLGSLICQSEVTAGEFEQIYARTEWMEPITEEGLLTKGLLTSADPRIAGVINGILDLLIIPMEQGMPEAMAEVEVLRGVSDDKMIKQAVLSYDGVRLAHQLAVKMLGHANDVKQLMDALAETVAQKSRLTYDTKLLSERLQVTDATFTASIPDLQKWMDQRDWQCLCLLEHMITEAVKYHEQQRVSLLKTYAPTPTSP